MNLKPHPQLYYLSEVLGVSQIFNSPNQLLSDVLFLVPRGLNNQAQTLLQKIVEAAKTVQVKVVEWEEAAEVNMLSTFAQAGGRWVLVFGSSTFHQLVGQEVDFFSAITLPTEKAGLNIFASHDLMDMIENRPHVTALKKQVWQQIKIIQQQVKLG